ncbi:MAG: hypothetical protein ABIP68_05150, partial [Ferruginibacter sp.]
GGGVIDTTGGGGVIDTTGGGTTRDCKACVYIPICDSSFYKYKDTINGTAGTVTSNYRITRDTTIGGKVFQKLYVDATNYAYYNCTNGVTTSIIYNPTSLNGTTYLIKVEMINLKANEPVNATWRSTIDYNGQLMHYDYKIISKGNPRTVDGRTYADVIRVGLTNISETPGQGTMVSGTGDYYYARGVGLIEVVLTDAGGNPGMHRVLESYIIP